MTKFILRWAINAIALYVAAWLITGVDLNPNDYVSFIWLALIFGLVNALVRPLIALLTCPLIILTLGLGTLLINTGMLYLTAWIATYFNIDFTLSGFWPAFLGALVISIVSVALSLVIKDGRKHRK